MDFHAAKKWIWWTYANNRRCDLIEKKHLGDGFTAEDELELRVLQAMADVIVSASFGPASERR